MTCRCPTHGLRLCALVSPDALAVAGPGDASNLLLVKLFLDGKFELAVTISKQFAEQHGIVADSLDYEEVYVHSEWFPQLTAICHRCFTERWPEVVERLRKMC